MKSDAAMDRLLRESLDRPAAADALCPDPETIAAWADDGLDARDRAAVEAHAAACARCQAMLAMVVRTAEPRPAGASRRLSALGWLIPLTAAAAAVVFWIAGPERRAAQVPQAVTGAPPPARVDSMAARSAPEPLQPVERGRAAAAPPAPTEPDLAERREAFRQSADAPQAAPAPGSTRTGRVVEQKQAGARAANELPPNAPVTASRAAAADARDAKTELADALPVNVVTPDPQRLWRVAGGRVQRSTDGGQTWQAQQTGADLQLRVGAAPTSSICWMVGRGGAVVLSTDGSSWRRLAFPDSTVDLVAVQAFDDRSAIVTASDGRRFRTADAGATWTGLPPQEFPAAPF
jgi:putative zinc finger protein